MEVGNKAGFPLQLDPDQLQTVSDWIHSDNDAARSAAYALYKTANVPLPPSMHT